VTCLKNSLNRWGRYRIIMDRVDNQPYLERYYVFLRDRERFPFNVFVHKFLKSDTEDVHDHPWPFLTVILKGGYWEWRPQFDARPKGRRDCQMVWTGKHSVGQCPSVSQSGTGPRCHMLDTILSRYQTT
jgi:hypothetical protein